MENKKRERGEGGPTWALIALVISVVAGIFFISHFQEVKTWFDWVFQQ